MSFALPANHSVVTGSPTPVFLSTGEEPPYSYQTFICNELIDFLDFDKEDDDRDVTVRNLNFSYVANRMDHFIQHEAIQCPCITFTPSFKDTVPNNSIAYQFVRNTEIPTPAYYGHLYLYTPF
ncbi:hypothetical protein ACI6Q2_07550 [Chitinophagaceae bacterium LWZ2-11]